MTDSDVQCMEMSITIASKVQVNNGLRVGIVV